MFSTETKQGANATISDAKNTAYSAKRDLTNASDEASNDFSDVANKAGRKVRGFVSSASDEFTNASEKVTGEIRNNPLRSSAIALGLGFVLGALFRR